LTIEAQYIACCLTTPEAIWLKSFLQDLDLTPRINDPVEMLCDNTAAIKFARDPKLYRKTKHIMRRYHCVRNAIKVKEVVIKYVSVSRMIADPLTKPIPRDAFKAHVMSLSLHRT